MISKDMRPFLVTILLSLSLLACASSGMRHPKDGQKFLAEAIDALSGKIECKESDYSTENEEILSAIKSRSFDVVEYSVDEQDGETAHRFILKRHAPPDTLVAELIVTGERCQEYMFGKIVD